MTTLRLQRLLALVALALALALLVAPSASETLTPDGLLSKLNKDDRVTLTTADGQEKEITVAEMERLAQAQHRKQAEMQHEASVHAAAASSGTVEYKEDPETAPKLKTESLETVRKSDPRFAANIELAKQSFAEIQRHGYARGYVLAGFSEKDEAAAADKHRSASAKAAKSKSARRDYRATLLLRAKRDAGDATAKTGTSPTKREVEPLTVAYEVHALLDARDHFAVLAAWELDASDARSTRLSIQARDTGRPTPTEQTTASEWTLSRVSAPTWILAGGVALIGAGVVVLYTSQRPVPAARRARGRSADQWELVTDKKMTTKPSAATKKTN